MNGAKRHLSIALALLLAGLGVMGCSRRSSTAGEQQTSVTSPANATPPPQDPHWDETVATDLLLTRYLDENSDVVASDYNSATRTFRSAEVIQGKSWFTQEESSKVPYDFALEVTDHPGRLILFRKRSDPSPTPLGFMGKATEAEVQRLKTLAKEPYLSREERIQSFLNSWSDIALVRCDQITGNVRDFYAYKGDHFKSNNDINVHKDLIIQEAYKSSYMGHAECILYGNFDRQPSKAHVVWIARNYLLFPGRQSLFEADFKTAASKLRKK